VLGAGGELAVEAAVAVGDEPRTHCDRHAPRMDNSCPTTSAGKIINATPPRVMAALVVTLPIMGFQRRPGERCDPETNMSRPTQTRPLRLDNFAPNSRAVSFWAAPNSVLARLSFSFGDCEAKGECWSTGVVECWWRPRTECWNIGMVENWCRRARCTYGL